MQLLARGIQAGYAAVEGVVRLATGRAGSAKERKRPEMPAGRARWCRGTHGGAGAGVAPESSGLVGRTLHLHASKPFPIAAEATGVPVATISRRDIRLDRRKPGSLFSPHVRAGPARQDSPRGSSRTRPGSTGPSLGIRASLVSLGGGGRYPPRRPGCRQRDAPHRGGDWRAVATDRGRGVVPAGDGRGAARPGSPSAGRPRGGAHGSGLRPPGPGRGPQLPDRQGRVAYRRVGDPRWDQHQVRALVERLLAAR